MCSSGEIFFIFMCFIGGVGFLSYILASHMETTVKAKPFKWGDWKRYKHCGKCDYLQKPFIGDFSDKVCPNCGSDDVKTVTARWEERTVNMGMLAKRVLGQSQIQYKTPNDKPKFNNG